MDLFDYIDPDLVKTYREESDKYTIHQNCEKCGLYQYPVTPKVVPMGEAAEGYLLGASPRRLGDEIGEHFHKQETGISFLRRTMRNSGLNPLSWRVNNAIQCRKIKIEDGKKITAQPTYDEVALCRPRIFSDLQKVDPVYIIALGRYALSSVLNVKGIDKYRGNAIPSRELNAWVFPMLHPLRVKKASNTDEPVFKLDMKQIAKYVINKIPISKIQRFVVVQLINIEQILSVLKRALKQKRVCIDFECRNIRPYWNDSLFVSCAITWDGVTAYSFPVDKTGELTPKQAKKVKELLAAIWAKEEVAKLVHNINMEKEWSEIKTIAGCKLRGRIDDTQRMCYAFDTRVGTHSLAHITYINFGVTWKTKTDRYKKDMNLCPTPLLLEYGGEDVIWTWRNFEHYSEKFESDSVLYNMYRSLLIEGALACTEIQMNGVVVDSSYIEVIDKDLTSKLNAQKRKLRSKEFVIQYEKTKNKRINFNSTEQISDFLYDYLKLTPKKKTKKGNISLDAEVLQQHASDKGKESEFCKELIIYRTFQHQHSTWVEGVKKVIYPDGLFHQNLNNTRTSTGRLSSDDPNLQNFPIRQEMDHPVRKMIVPPPVDSYYKMIKIKGKYVIASFDYDQLEATNLGIVSGDKNYKDALASGYDIHLEEAKWIFGSKNGVVERTRTKNDAVFPAFYGAGIPLIARNCGKSEDHIRKWYAHLFGQDMFWRIREWQEEQVTFYNKHSYVETRSGRKRYGPMDTPRIYNTPIQGLSSDYCVLSMIKLIKLGYFVALNVHDQLDNYLPEKNLEEDLFTIKTTMEDLPIEWTDGVKVTVGCKIGYDWYNLEKIIL